MKAFGECSGLVVLGEDSGAISLSGRRFSPLETPAGVPVATVAIGSARNAGLLAVRILAASDDGLREKMVAFQADLRATALAKGEKVRAAQQG